jgi:hypothetical protein
METTTNATERLFDVAKGQDIILHNLSAELGVKTSLYLVFTAFMFSASIQTINLAKDLPRYSHCAVAFSSISAALSLLAATALLIAALVREYFVFPSSRIQEWLVRLEEYKVTYPEAITANPTDVMLRMLIETGKRNKLENEKKADQITWGARILFSAIPFLIIGGTLAVCGYFSRPS